MVPMRGIGLTRFWKTIVWLGLSVSPKFGGSRPESQHPMRYHSVVHTFLCDAMLGSLARWLRLFGFDADFADPSLDDDEVSSRARADGRWLLTRDRELAAAGPRSMLVQSTGLEAQLVEVFLRLGIEPDPNLDQPRCAECNGSLLDVTAHDVEELVPPYVLATADRFRRCSDCGKVYWPGTHTDRIRSTLERVTESLARGGRESGMRKAESGNAPTRPFNATAQRRKDAKN